MKSVRLEFESLEPRNLLSVTAGAFFPAEGAPAFPLPAAGGSTVYLSGEEVPSAVEESALVNLLLQTSRPADGDFSSLTLYVGIDAPGIALLSPSEFDPHLAGFDLADTSLAEVPDITVTPLFSKNLITNGDCAFYLYRGGPDAPVSGEWYLKGVWFDLTLSGDWTGGAETVAGELGLLALGLNFHSGLTSPTSATVDFAADCGEDWSVDSQPCVVTAGPETSDDLVAAIAPAAVSVQSGCRFFLSGAGSYSASGKTICSWLWEYTGRGLADAEGEELWFSAGKLNYVNGVGRVTLSVGAADGSFSAPAEAEVTCRNVSPSVSGALTSFADERALLAEFSFRDAAGAVGAFWEIDWGDGTVEEFQSLSNTLSAAHFYADAGSNSAVSVRVTDTEGNASPFVRIG